MERAEQNIEINLGHIQEGLSVFLDARRPNTLFDFGLNAEKNNEARFQLVEGCFYEYEINNADYQLGDIGENIIQFHKRNTHLGTISPNIFTGTLSIPLFKKGMDEKLGEFSLEVQSIKTDYRSDYRDMLEFITEQCTELLLQANAPSSHFFEPDFNQDSKALYQRFTFVQSVVGSEEFSEAMHKITTAPSTSWSESLELKDTRRVRRFSTANIKEICKGGNPILSGNLPFWSAGGGSFPEKISSLRKTDSIDTPENRFVKHALETFLKFCMDINSVANKGSKLEKESMILIHIMESHLHHNIFREISRPATLQLNSPVLQRREGYREILRVWLMFDLAAKLTWTGGNDIYSGGKKDIATLYEYWLFFKLLNLLRDIFDIEPKDVTDLIKFTPDGLGLQLKQGFHTALTGVYQTGSRKLHIRFNYNRSFSGNNTYPNSGSWTTSLRPDYTLSFWPFGIDETEAEKEELIVHVHFDAKYKVANLYDILGDTPQEKLDEEKKDNRKGIYKNADLLKMHAYKDAIRRTGGAYVLYPGELSIRRNGFHEIIPGLGAFPVRPSKKDSGIADLKTFILEMIEHFINRTSQREKLAYRTFDIHKNPPNSENELREKVPEPYGSNRSMIPDETFILVGYYDPIKYGWIEKNKQYPFRMGSGNGALILDAEVVGARYLLLHTSGEKDTNKLWKIVSRGPKVLSKQDLIRKKYPTPRHENYLVIDIEIVTDSVFKDVRWDFKKLVNYSSGRSSALPYTTTLSELMQNKVS